MDTSEKPAGNSAELLRLLERLQDALWREEPRPCKEILAALMARRWPDDVDIHLVELHRLIRNYRLGDAFKLLEKGLKDRTGQQPEGIEPCLGSQTAGKACLPGA